MFVDRIKGNRNTDFFLHGSLNKLAISDHEYGVLLDNSVSQVI